MLNYNDNYSNNCSVLPQKSIVFFQRNKPKFASLCNTWNAAHSYPHYSGFQGYPCTKFTMVPCEQMSIMDKFKCHLVFAFSLCYYHWVKLSWPSSASVCSWCSVFFCNTFYYSRILLGEENENNFIYLYSSSDHTHRINHQKKKFVQVFKMKMNFKMQVIGLLFIPEKSPFMGWESFPSSCFSH